MAFVPEFRFQGIPGAAAIEKWSRSSAYCRCRPPSFFNAGGRRRIVSAPTLAACPVIAFAGRCAGIDRHFRHTSMSACRLGRFPTWRTRTEESPSRHPLLRQPTPTCCLLISIEKQEPQRHASLVLLSHLAESVGR